MSDSTMIITIPGDVLADPNVSLWDYVRPQAEETISAALAAGSGGNRDE